MTAGLLTCVSHGPALEEPMPEPPEHPAMMAAYDARAAAFQVFDPELVVIFAPDHYTGVHLQMAPPFLRRRPGGRGGGATSAAMRGGSAFRRAWPCGCCTVRAADIDIAVSHDMTVDHGFSQPLYKLARRARPYPTLPVFINTTCAPVSAFRRVRLLGEAVGRLREVAEPADRLRGLGRHIAPSGQHFPADAGRRRLRAEGLPALWRGEGDDGSRRLDRLTCARGRQRRPGGGSPAL